MLVLSQTLHLAFRKGGGALGAMAFYVITVTLFTFAMGPEDMAAQSQAVMCVAFLLSSVTAMPLFFERDHDDGTLEQFLLFPMLLELVVLAKLLGQWLACMLPILAVSPLLALASQLPASHLFQVILMLIAASPSVVALSAIASALTVGAKRGGLLQALIVMPLYIPVLIFATTPQTGAFWLLLALGCASVPLSCMACAALIRISQD